jgi:DNA-binding winged helix-turn-helix (wHTH) protein
MNQPANHCYEFGPFRLSPVERLLLRDGQELPLPPKIFDILLLLVQNHGHLLEKETMINAIWPDTFVEEGNLTRCISTLRQALGGDRNRDQYILTIPKRGYRFVARVNEVRDDIASRLRPAQTSLAVQSVAVLPFKSLVVEGRDQALELGMADTLITRLGSISQVAVKPTSAVRRYTDLDQDAVAAGRELRVEAVLDGTIQRSDERIRVTARLVSVLGGVTLWAGQFDETFTDTFSVQDSISERMAGSLAVKLGGEEKP